MRRILVVEDEPSLADALARAVRRMGHEVEVAPSGELGLERAAAGEAPVDLVVLDIGLPDRSGLDVLRVLRAERPDVPVVVITAHGNLQNAVAARKEGATRYLVKPLDVAEFTATLRALLDEPAEGIVEPAGARAARPPHGTFLIGSSPAMQPAFSAIATACASDVPVLITGPTGIGKSLTARIIHLNSSRHEGPFVTLSCASLPENLLEAELFGHERGAFTGAGEARTGHVERAVGGTLFLDEIGDVPMPLQVKLLRVVEEKAFTRVGGREEVEVDLRIVAATNQDLDAAVREKRFREDLLYRLRVLEVELPALVHRPSDLPALCSYMLGEIGGGGGRMSLSREALAELQAHDWPGNVRELRNVLEHAAAVCGGDVILAADLPSSVRDGGAGAGRAGGGEAVALDAALAGWLEARLAEPCCDYETLLGELERKLLSRLLPRYGEKPTVLARELGMNRATLRRKLRDLGLRGDDGG